MNNTKEIAIIRVPLWYGCEMHGVELAPALLSEALKASEFKQNIVEEIDIPIPEIQADSSIDIHTQYINPVVEVNKHLASVVAQQLAQGRLVLTIGGDHAIGLGTVSGSLKQDENVGIIWFDAHGDMNTEATSPTGHIHGMPTAALMGLCKSELNEVANPYLKPDNIFWIGARSLDEGERELAKKLHLSIYPTKHIHNVGMKAVMLDICEKMHQQDIQHLHLSFDVDAFDPTIFPATGVPVRNGLWMEEFDEFVSLLPTLPKLSAIDIVEYNPLLEIAEQSSKEICLSAIIRLLLTKISS